jgi:hypothetical protein
MFDCSCERWLLPVVAVRVCMLESHLIDSQPAAPGLILQSVSNRLSQKWHCKGSRNKCLYNVQIRPVPWKFPDSSHCVGWPLATFYLYRTQIHSTPQGATSMRSQAQLRKHINILQVDGIATGTSFLFHGQIRATQGRAVPSFTISSGFTTASPPIPQQMVQSGRKTETVNKIQCW